MGNTARSSCYAWSAMKSLRISFVLLTLVVYGKANVQGDDSSAISCSLQQQRACKGAAENGNLNTLNGGGVCEKQRYVHFTHTCTLNQYLPGVDFCCCALNQTLLCCRYSQNDHDLYRCQLEQDYIGTITYKSGDGAAANVKLGILLPLVLVPLILAVTLLVCCIHRKNKNKQIRRQKAEDDKNRREYELQPLAANGDTVNTPENSEGKRPLDEILEGDRLEPTAPSDAVPVAGGEGRYSREDSGPVLPSYQPHPHPDGGHGVPGARGNSTPSTPCPSCSGQPPSYMESLQHQVV